MKINTGCWVDGCRRFDPEDEDGVEIKRDREWVGLTDEEVHEAFCHVEYETFNDWKQNPESWCLEFSRYIEIKLKAKNGF